MQQGSYISTISIQSNSEYVNTFEDLNIGTVFDFHFKNYDTDKTWVNIWGKHYKDGEMEPDPIAKLSYGLSPNKDEEGNIGLVILETGDHSPFVFLYSPSVTTAMEKIGEIPSVNVFKGWDYAIGEDE